MNCGGQIHTMICPWCGNLIGGTDYIPVVRAGHEVMEDAIAKVYLRQLLTKCETNLRPGYNPVLRPEKSTTLTNE